MSGYPSTASLQITLDAVDISSYIQEDTIEISSVLTKQVDTARFILEVAQGLTINKWDEVIIYDGATKLFGGYLMITEDVPEKVDLYIDCQCSDYSVLLQKPIVKEEFLTSTTDQAIIESLFTDYLPGINSTTYVNAIKTWTDGIRFNRKTLWECMDILANSAGADWYVDQDKNLHYFLNEENTAPYDISDSPDFSTTFPCSGLKKTGDGSGIVNRVEVVGGNYLSDNATIYLKGTGQDPRAIMPFKMHMADTASAVMVWRNDGSDSTASWTSLTVKVGYIDQLSTTNDVLHYFNDKVLESYANWPNLERAIKVFGRYEVPLLVRMVDDDSKDLTGTNIYFDDVIIDKNIVSISQAKTRGLGRLAEKKLEQISLSFTVLEPGLKAGQIITVNNTVTSTSASYLIYRVTGKLTNTGYGSYDVEAGVYNESLVDFMIAIAKDRKGEVEWREDEVLNEFRSHTEIISVSEVHSFSTNATPYVWGTTTASNDLVWSFGVWS